MEQPYQGAALSVLIWNNLQDTILRQKARHRNHMRTYTQHKWMNLENIIPKWGQRTSLFIAFISVLFEFSHHMPILLLIIFKMSTGTVER